MIQTVRSTHGMAVAPHALASQSALAVLRDGGNAIEAMVAAAATISVVYPHMNGIGGDAFWLIVPPTGDAIAIDAAGQTAKAATIAAYKSRGLESIPIRGPLAMNTVAGAIGSWDAALNVSQQHGGRQSLSRLLADAIDYAHNGMPVTASQSNATQAKFKELAQQPGFAERFLVRGQAPATGVRFRQPRLGDLMARLSDEGMDSF